MNNDLLYNLEYQLNEKRKATINNIRYNEMTIKEFLDLGFNNSDIKINGRWRNLGYKWFTKNYKTDDYIYGYESGDFGELTPEQLNVKVKFVRSETTDENYTNVDVRLVNDDDSKYFVKESE